ncbi:Tyrosine-protein phosphatase YwqE [Sphingobacterium nematocida]|uniref:protein-tyrosine-phosphatase n=1 Tax=Sphingobacterium nematocida TaxID=1513896 RepID=A0A1T5EYD1_9SPHI|nr:CpsB/CapC family capsule biosynthesis tyrosine phosphatase [Sphingobacterium nematocida]SKB88947.1 Tyrosine-protein phosphatase YwqE [Sphingobacterium nematocida]
MGILSRLFGKGQEEAKENSLGKLAFLQVDMHNHLLPGIDDGSQSTEQSVLLIKGLHAMGFEKFICTPHIMAGVHPNTKSTIAAAHEVLNKELHTTNPKVQIFAAAEHMIDEELETIIKMDNLCVMPGGYVLIEMSYIAESKALFQTILDIQNLGYKPILAHPERYNYYHYNFDMYKQIKDAGCLLQLNLLSISRHYGKEVKEAALKMIKSGMYDFVGTDTHHERHMTALQDVVAKYPVRDLLRTCPIKNPTLLDHL